MNEKKTNNQSVTFKIEEKRVTINMFSQRVRRFFNLIEDVSKSVTGKTKAIEWLLSIKPGTITLKAKPESINGSPEDVKKTITVLEDGFQAINERSKRPEYFSDFALNILFELGSMVGLGDKENGRLKIGIGKSYYDISPKSVAFIDEIMGTENEAYGTIEGNLLALKIKGRLNFSIWETLTGKEVKCFFGDELYDDVISSIRKRVSVYGLIHYNKVGRPLKIEIEKLIQFPDDSELPKFKDIIGLFKD